MSCSKRCTACTATSARGPRRLRTTGCYTRRHLKPELTIVISQRSHVSRMPAALHPVHRARAARSMRTRFAHVWDAYSSSRRRQRPIGFPPGVRDVHSAHPLRHATQVAKSSRDRLRRECCLAAPRAREARRRGSVRDGARDVKTVKPAVAAASCAVVALPRCSGDEGVSSGARERRAPDPREARGVGGAAAPQPAVARLQELGP